MRDVSENLVKKTGSNQNATRVKFPVRVRRYPLPLSPLSTPQPSHSTSTAIARSSSFESLGFGFPLLPLASMAISEVVLEVHPQPPPEAALPVVPVPKFLQYLYLASAWVACAGVAAATAARRALGDDSPVTCTFLKVSVGALAFPSLLVFVVALRLLRAMCASGLRLSLRTFAREIQINSRKVSRTVNAVSTVDSSVFYC